MYFKISEYLRSPVTDFYKNLNSKMPDHFILFSLYWKVVDQKLHESALGVEVQSILLFSQYMRKLWDATLILGLVTSYLPLIIFTQISADNDNILSLCGLFSSYSFSEPDWNAKRNIASFCLPHSREGKSGVRLKDHLETNVKMKQNMAPNLIYRFDIDRPLIFDILYVPFSSRYYYRIHW